MLLEDILDSIGRIEHYIRDVEKDAFEADRKTVDAVVRYLEIIGEAANNLPKSYRDRHSEIQWGQIIGLRHRVIHEYFDVDIDIIWFIVQNELALFRKQVEKLLGDELKSDAGT